MTEHRWRPVAAMVGAAVLCLVAVGVVASGPDGPADVSTGASPPEAPAPPGPVLGINPKVETTPGARTTVVRYGPFTVPPARGPGHNDAGMLENQVAAGSPMPCQDCYITGFRPQLLDADGRVANYDTGAMLHHFILFASGKTDPTCGDVYKPIGARVLAGANDRTQAMFPKGTGYHIAPAETWLLITDLMNMTMQPRPMVLEMSYDWVPASTPDMQGALPVWLDVGPCGQSWVKADRGTYSRTGTWKVNVPGRVLGLAGHLHDGGTRIEVRNTTTGERICESVASYGGPGYVEQSPDAHHGGPPGSGHGDGPGHGSVERLSAMSQCVAPSRDRPLAAIERDQQVEFEAFYDDAAHPHPPESTVMGTIFMFVLP